MLFHGVPLNCINQSALHYHVPAAIIISVMQIEGGQNGQSVKNKNGTYDLGVMQINTRWLPRLNQYGINEQSLRRDPCLNVDVGTWILAQGIAKGKGWSGVGNYHSFTQKHNRVYREKVKIRYEYAISLLKQEDMG